jgi:hypothetical protein
MKVTEKFKTQKVLDKIQSGSFDENDVDNLLIRLRAYSSGHNMFREFADLVAHNDERDRGVTNESLKALYLSIKFFIEYVSANRSLEISTPFPLYVKNLMMYQVDKTDESILQERYTLTRKRLKSRLDNLFKEDKRSGTACLSESKIQQNTFEALKHIMSFIGTKPIITQDTLIEEIISVVTKNKLEVDEEALNREAPRITLAALLLLHEAHFVFGGYKPGYCRISCEKTSIIHGLHLIDKHIQEFQDKEEFGSLQVLGYVILDKDGKDLTICFPVMTTSLKADDWCDESMFNTEPFSEHNTELYRKVVNFDADLSLNMEFRLCRTNPNYPKPN